MASHKHPVPHCYLQKGKLIGADVHRGFVDTFNWLVDWCWNFKVGNGLKFEHNPDSAHPVISVDGEVSATTFVGTDESETSISDDDENKIEIKSADDSNITVTADGNVLTIGAYYV